MPRSLHLISRLLLFVMLAATVPPAGAQDVGGEDKPNSGLLLRILCKRPIEGATDLKILQAGKVLHDLELRPSLVTDPLEITRGPLVLARERMVDGEASYDPVLIVPVPGAGKRFVLALFPAPKPTPDEPYLHRLLRTDGQRFGTSDLYLFNLTGVPVGGRLGTTSFNLAPDSSAVRTPKPDQPGDRMYQSRFYCQVDGKPRIFNDTRWPLAKSARIYLFFLPDPERRSIGYQSFREYAPYP